MKLIPKHFRKTVTIAGTRERLTASAFKTPMVDFQAESTNTGRIYIGHNQVSSTDCMADLGAGDSLSLIASNYGDATAVWDLSEFWIDSSISTDGVFVGYAERKQGE